MKNFILLIALLFSQTVGIAQEWDDINNLPNSALGRHHPVTFSIDGTGFLLAGGSDEIGELKDFYRYEAAANFWIQLENFPGPARSYAYGLSANGIGYVGFGQSPSQRLNDLWAYNASNNEWTELAPCPCEPRLHPAMLHLNGKIYVGLGGGSNGDIKDWWAYDIATNSWEEKTTFPGSQRHHPFYFAIDNYAYVGFGHHLSNIYDDFYRYDPLNDSWDQMNDFPGEGRVAGTQFTYNGKGYVLSGEGQDHGLMNTGEFWEYTPETDNWFELTPHPGSSRWAPGSFVIDNNVYLIAGESNNGLEKDMWVFNLEVASNTSSLEEQATVNLYPNPATNELYFTEATLLKKHVEIYDINGKKLISEASCFTKLDIQKLLPGQYFIKIFDNHQVATGKFIKTN